jgi:hypothetical protein
MPANRHSDVISLSHISQFTNHLIYHPAWRRRDSVSAVEVAPSIRDAPIVAGSRASSGEQHAKQIALAKDSDKTFEQVVLRKQGHQGDQSFVERMQEKTEPQRVQSVGSDLAFGLRGG